MTLSFHPVTLDQNYGDAEGMLVYHSDRLMAVLARLGSLHDNLAGCWFIEASFSPRMIHTPATFQSLADFEAWVGI